MSRPESDGGLLRALGAYDTLNYIVGTVIGSGIFLVPSEIARALGSAGVMLGVWVAGGLLTLFGVLSLAELGAAIPVAGGIYTFIRRAYGPLLGFVCGWTLFAVVTTGSIATLAAALSIYVGGLVPISAE